MAKLKWPMMGPGSHQTDNRQWELDVTFDGWDYVDGTGHGGHYSYQFKTKVPKAPASRPSARQRRKRRTQPA